MFGSDSKEYLITLFEYAPISLWEQDFSRIKFLFDDLKKQGVVDFESYLDSHPEFIDECMREIKVLNVNQQTVSMFKAQTKEEFLANLNLVFRDGMRHHFRSELISLWNGAMQWSGEGINYTLRGEALDIILHWRILPEHEKNWDKVLVTIENITARKRAEKRLESLFESSPISLWEEDYSEIKKYFDSLQAQGIEDFEMYLFDNPEIALHCMSLIKVLNVNQKTLELFGASTKQDLLNNLGQVFRDEMGTHFSKELVDLWNGKVSYEREGINYSLTGEPVNILLNFRIMPGHEDDFAWVTVAIQDITVRKKAEEYLRYLGTHDVMTGLYNRAYFEETILKLESNRHDPISIVIVDLNYLKHVNDSLGHQAGDKLIRRVAEVLQAACEDKYFAARIGGDEFVIILSGENEETANELMKHIHVLVEMNNKFYREPELSISIGSATSTPDLTLEKIINLADDAMYRHKGEYHRRRKDDPKI